MFTTTIKHIVARLERYTFFARVFSVLRQTPQHATHWYSLLVFGIIIALANVAIAWFSFSGVSNAVADASGNTTNVTTINREKLQKALDVYQARAQELQQLRQTAPDITDPGR